MGCEVQQVKLATVLQVATLMIVSKVWELLIKLSNVHREDAHTNPKIWCRW